jgi:hypothetical protein
MLFVDGSALTVITCFTRSNSSCLYFTNTITSPTITIAVSIPRIKIAQSGRPLRAAHAVETVPLIASDPSQRFAAVIFGMYCV